MKLFDEYLIKRYGWNWVGVLGLFVGLLSVVLLVDDFEDFIEHKAAWSLVVKYILLSIPGEIVRFFPLIVLVAVVFTVHRLMKGGEFTAMMAAGVGLRRLSFGFILMGLCFTGLQFVFHEYWASWCNGQAHRIMRHDIQKKTSGFSVKNGLFLRGANNRYYHYQYFDPDRKVLGQVQIFQPDPSNQFLKRYIHAEWAEYHNGKWILQQGEDTRFEGREKIQSVPFQTQEFQISETPEDFVNLTRLPRNMSFRDLTDYMEVIESSGEDPSRHATELYLKLSFPWTCLVFTWVALAISLRMHGRNLSLELAVAVLIMFLYYLLLGMLINFGNEQVLPATVAAWGVPVGMGGVSLLVFLNTRTESG